MSVPKIRRKLKWTTVVWWLLGSGMIAAVLFLVFSATDSPVVAVDKFLWAFRTRDLQRLSELTWVPDTSPPPAQQWREIFAQGKPVPLSHKSEPLMVSVTGDKAVVKMLVLIHDRTPPQEREIQFFVRRIGDKWKVDVTRLVRDPFGKLPF